MAEGALPIVAELAALGGQDTCKAARRRSRSFTSSNCCVTAAPGLRLRFDALSIQPSGKCNQVGYVDPVYPLTNFILPLATNHFAGHTISENAGCSENNNPALFFKTRL
jgi:hypothetical protein